MADFIASLFYESVHGKDVIISSIPDHFTAKMSWLDSYNTPKHRSDHSLSRRLQRASESFYLYSPYLTPLDSGRACISVTRTDVLTLAPSLFPLVTVFWPFRVP